VTRTHALVAALAAAAMVLLAVSPADPAMRPAFVIEHQASPLKWDDALESEWRDVMACLGVHWALAVDKTLRLYVLPDTAPEVRIDGGYAIGLYFPMEHAIVLRHDWTPAVLRHEFVHAAFRTAEHGPIFMGANNCNLTPAPFPYNPPKAR
jgi:hypothetical protein